MIVQTEININFQRRHLYFFDNSEKRRERKSEIRNPYWQVWSFENIYFRGKIHDIMKFYAFISARKSVIKISEVEKKFRMKLILWKEKKCRIFSTVGFRYLTRGDWSFFDRFQATPMDRRKSYTRFSSSVHRFIPVESNLVILVESNSTSWRITRPI